MNEETKSADPPNLLRATPVLMCADYLQSRAFYVDRLGFHVVEEGGDPPRFGILERGKSVIFLNAWHGARPPVPEVWDAYIHVRGVDGLASAFHSDGVPVTKDLHDTVYGMRELEVTDPDGNVLCFGEDADVLAT